MSPEVLLGLVEPKVRAQFWVIMEPPPSGYIGGLGYDDYHLTSSTTGNGGADPLGAREGLWPRLGEEIDRDPVYSDADR